MSKIVLDVFFAKPEMNFFFALEAAPNTKAANALVN